MNSWLLIGGDLIFLALIVQGRMAAAKEHGRLISKLGYMQQRQDEIGGTLTSLAGRLASAIQELPKRRSKKAQP